MKGLVVFIAFVWVYPLYSQDTVKHSYYTWLDLPRDTYIRLITTADSLFGAYKSQPFDFELKDGSCCLSGTTVIKNYYQKALLEQPEDEDAKRGLKKIENYIEDRYLLTVETDHKIIEQKADTYFSQGYFLRAKLLYEKAYTINPSSTSLKKKLKSCRKNIKKYRDI